MTYAIEVPAEFGYVLTVAAGSFFLNTALSIQVSIYRKAANIAYPIAYANDELAAKDPKALQFNCAQRAHLNFGEAHTSWLGSVLIAGLRYPVATSALGALWLVGRAMYGRGYVTGGPNGRLKGATLGFLTDAALKFLALYAAVSFAMGN